MSTQIYLCNIRALDDEDKYKSAYESVDSTRRAKADRYRMQADKCRCVVAGCLLRYGLLLQNVYDCDMGVSESGKPFLKNHKDIFFNLSHAGDEVMCVISDKECGCDVEMYAHNGMEEIAERFYSKKELEYATSADNNEEKIHRLIRQWTVKESVLKANGSGLSGGVDSVDAILPNAIGSVFHIRDYSLVEFVSNKDYAYTVAILGDLGEYSVNRVEVEDILMQFDS
ncbi:MAG: 4'-phosphopantetheinyl transferase superfamily protein [Lachnospiraceae bacterium]|nr:4'-phosphopantetheinyl transferase superfamily protein [Candidatus Colinaster equi]